MYLGRSSLRRISRVMQHRRQRHPSPTHAPCSILFPQSHWPRCTSTHPRAAQGDLQLHARGTAPRNAPQHARLAPDTAECADPPTHFVPAAWYTKNPTSTNLFQNMQRQAKTSCAKLTGFLFFLHSEFGKGQGGVAAGSGAVSSWNFLGSYG
jgi:hypothetical protein